MIALKVKDCDDKGVSVRYKTNDSNSYEHLAAMTILYNDIKENSDLTDEEIFEFIKTFKEKESE